MFFPKLRRRAKWVFLFLAIAFAFSFVFFGVGAGGSGIGDYLSDLLNRPVSSDTPSLDDAQEAVAERPNDPEAQLDLARAAQAEGDVDLAIAAYEEYRSAATRGHGRAPHAGRALRDADRGGSGAGDDRLERGGGGVPPEHARSRGQRVPAGADDEPLDRLAERPGPGTRKRRERRGAEPLARPDRQSSPS